MVPAIQDAHEIQVQRDAARSAAAATLGPCFIAVVVRLELIGVFPGAMSDLRRRCG